MEAYWERTAERNAAAIEKQRKAARAAWLALLQAMRMRAQLKSRYEDTEAAAGGMPRGSSRSERLLTHCSQCAATATTLPEAFFFGAPVRHLWMAAVARQPVYLPGYLVKTPTHMCMRVVRMSRRLLCCQYTAAATVHLMGPASQCFNNTTIRQSGWLCTSCALHRDS